MKFPVDYAKLLIRQCELACSAFEEKSVSDLSQKVFREIYKHLTIDFLPPIDREDIAALSYDIFEIQTKCETYFGKNKCRILNSKIKEQLDLMPYIIKGLLEKKKTCGDDIHRFIILNTAYGKVADSSSIQINDSLAGFIKTAYSAFFKNL